MKYFSAFAVSTMLSTAMGFAPVHNQAPRMTTSMQASFDPMNLSENKITDHVPKFATAAAATLLLSPLAALAGEFHVYIFCETQNIKILILLTNLFLQYVSVLYIYMSRGSQ